MKSMRYLTLLGVLAIAGFTAPALAHDDGGHLSRMWQMTPKMDARDAFNEGFKKHLEWRKANDDPWGWSVYNAASGKGINSVFVRSSGHHWADFDSYRDSEFAKKAQEHWNKHVHPHVKYYDSWIDEGDDELFYWPQDNNFRYFYVTTFYLQPGHGGAARRAVKAVHEELEAAGRKAPHVWIWAATGSHLPAFTVVTPRDDFAGFDWPEKSVFDTLKERVGEEKAGEMFMDFFEHVKRQESQIMVRDMDLSYDAAE